MSNPYDSQSISGYNSSPPPDDGSNTSSNEVTWAKHKTKLGDPIKTLAESINTELVAAFGKIFGANLSSKSGDYTIVAADQGKLFSVTGTTTITLPTIATAGQGFPVGVVNTGAGTVTVDGNGAETINGSASVTLSPGASVILSTDGTTEWLGFVTNGSGSTAAGDAATLDGIDSTGFLQVANNLSDLASAATARTNLGLGALAEAATVAGTNINAYTAGTYVVANIGSVTNSGSVNVWTYSTGYYFPTGGTVRVRMYLNVTDTNPTSEYAIQIDGIDEEGPTAYGNSASYVTFDIAVAAGETVRVGSRPTHAASASDLGLSSVTISVANPVMPTYSY